MSCPFAHNFQGTIDDDSPVARHIRGYSTNNILTKDSMTDNHTSQRISKNVGVKVKAIFNMMSDRKLNSTVDGLSLLVNPARSGIWNEKGHFDKDRFNELKMMSFLDQGKNIITKKIFDQFLEKKHGGKDHGTCTYVYYVVPISWKRVTQGSIEELFEYYSDHTYVSPKGDSHKTLTIERLYEFYTTPNVTKRRREGF